MHFCFLSTYACHCEEQSDVAIYPVSKLNFLFPACHSELVSESIQ